MKTVKNISPLGALAIPSLRLEVAAGATLELKNDVADLLLEQADNFVEVKRPRRSSAPRASASTTAPKKSTAVPASVPSVITEEI